MSDQEDLERRAAEDDYEAIESLAKQAVEAGELVRYRELLQRANRWPPPAGFSGAEAIAIADGDLAVLHKAFERNGKYGSLDALRTLISEAYEAGEVDVATEWFRRTAQFGDSQLLMILAGIAEAAADLDGERWCCEAAAELGDPQAMDILGELAQDAGDFTTAEAWYLKAADLGHADAMGKLGLLAYEAGDLVTATSRWEKAANLGSPGAPFNLGVLAEETGDVAGAKAWYTQAANLDHPEAMFNLGLFAKKAGDLSTAELWYTKAADLDDPDAAFELGDMAEDAGDVEKAWAWYEQAGNLGSGDAMCALGRTLRGVEGDNGRSLAWLERGASIGHAGATLYRYLIYPEHQVDFALQLRDRVAASLDLDDLGGALVVGFMNGFTAYPEDALWLMSPALIESGETEAAKRHRTFARRRYEARAEVGDTEAMLNLGQLLIQDGEDQTGRGWIEKSASLGEEGAAEALAELDDGAGR